MMDKENREGEACCSIPCDSNVIDDGRCPCYNAIKGVKSATMGSVTINYHFCSREEREELINYLSEKSWDFTEETKFIDDEGIELG